MGVCLQGQTVDRLERPKGKYIQLIQPKQPADNLIQGMDTCFIANSGSLILYGPVLGRRLPVFTCRDAIVSSGPFLKLREVRSDKTISVFPSLITEPGILAIR